MRGSIKGLIEVKVDGIVGKMKKDWDGPVDLVQFFRQFPWNSLDSLWIILELINQV